MTGIITVPLHIGDFLSGTMHMDTLEKGAFIMLMLAHYQSGDSGLPNDDKKLSRIAGVTPKVWQRIRPILEEKFTVTETKWISKRCVEVIQEVEQKSSAQRAKALKRHNSNDATAQPRHCQPKPKIKKEKNKQKNKKPKPARQPAKVPPDKPPKDKSHLWFDGDVIGLNERDYSEFLRLYGGNDAGFMDWLNARDAWLSEKPERQTNWFISTKRALTNIAKQE